MAFFFNQYKKNFIRFQKKSLELLKTVHDRCLFGEDVALESLDPATTPICRRPETRQVAFGLLAILCQNRACLEQMVRSLVSKHTNGMPALPSAPFSFRLTRH